MADWNRVALAVESGEPVAAHGTVKKIVGLMIESAGPRVGVGEYCHIITRKSREIPA